jgi:XapX domain-containing protein
MKLYLISLVVGVAVGCLYSLLGVKSPAPPAIALVGLLGMLIGEATIPLIRQAMAGEAAKAAIHSASAPSADVTNSETRRETN